MRAIVRRLLREAAPRRAVRGDGRRAAATRDLRAALHGPAHADRRAAPPPPLAAAALRARGALAAAALPLPGAGAAGGDGVPDVRPRPVRASCSGPTSRRAPRAGTTRAARPASSRASAAGSLGLRAWAEAEREAAETERDADRRERRLRHVADAEALLRVVELLGRDARRPRGRGRRGRSGSRGCARSSDQWLGPERDREAVLEVIADLGGLGSVATRAPWSEVEQVIEARFEWERLPLEPLEGGAVHVGALDAMAGLPFRVVAIPGLVEGGYPGVFRPDPFLLDSERDGAPSPGSWPCGGRFPAGARGIRCPRLSLRSVRAARPASPPSSISSRSPLSPASPPLARLRGGLLALACPAVTRPRRAPHHPGPPRRGAPALPPRRLAGDRAPDPLVPPRRRAQRARAAALALLRRRRRDARGPAGGGSRARPDGERRTTRCSCRSRTRSTPASATASGCAARTQPRRRSPRARRSSRSRASRARRAGRGGSRATTASSWTSGGELGAQLDPLHARHPVSASRLATYARCGFQYLLQNVLRLQPAPEPEERRRIDPLERGDLFHRVAEAFLRERRDRGELPVTRRRGRAASGSREMAEEALAGPGRGQPAALHAAVGAREAALPRDDAGAGSRARRPPPRRRRPPTSS